MIGEYNMLEDRKRTNRILLAFILGFVLLGFIAACTYKPQGCPLPLYSKGDVVLVDNVFVAQVIKVEVKGCGDIVYDVQDEESPVVEKGVVEGRLSPYVPDCE